MEFAFYIFRYLSIKLNGGRAMLHLIRKERERDCKEKQTTKGQNWIYKCSVLACFLSWAGLSAKRRIPSFLNFRLKAKKITVLSVCWLITKILSDAVPLLENVGSYKMGTEPLHQVFYVDSSRSVTQGSSLEMQPHSPPSTPQTGQWNLHLNELVDSWHTQDKVRDASWCRLWPD